MCIRDSANADVQFLGATDSIEETYTATIDDGNGGTDTQMVVVTINGANDAPVISIGTGDSAAETLVETDAALMTDGTLSVADVDVTDIVGVAVTNFAESGTTNGVGTIGMLTVDAASIIDNVSTTGTISWVFDSGTETVSYTHLTLPTIYSV